MRATLVGAAAGACALAATAGMASANPVHFQVGHRLAQPPTTGQCVQTFGFPCYGPTQYEEAYSMKRLYKQGLDGTGRTIVIVDSYGSPTIASDVHTFDQAYGLPDPNLQIIQPAGAVPPWEPNSPNMVNWGFETTLDVEYAHAMAPGANILLVETPVAETEGVTGFPQMMQAEDYVIKHHLGDVITQSFGATEETFPSFSALSQLRYAFQDAAANGVTVLGASGDGGATDYKLNGTEYYPFPVNSWPSSDPLVTSVGGTQLHLTDLGNRTAPDNVWNDTAMFNGPAAGGGGVSEFFSRPSYQDGVQNVVGGSRGTPDISMSAAVNGAAIVYLSYPGLTPGYYLVGGTSEASPLFSGVVAVADQAAGHDLGQINQSLYTLGAKGESGIVDITSGNNSVFFVRPNGQVVNVQGYNAVPGYDMASGLGTANGFALVHQLARLG